MDFRHLQQIEAGQINLTLASILRIADGFRVAPSSILQVEAKMTAARPMIPAKTNLKYGKGRRPPKMKQVTIFAPVGLGPATRKTQKRSSSATDFRPNPIPDTTTAEAAQHQVGRAVASFRLAADMTQTALAKRVGVSLKYVQRVEAGKQNLTIASLVRFANALQVEPRHLFEPLAWGS